MSTGPTNLFDLATSFLDAVVAYFESNGITLPSVQYLSSSSRPPLPCESLVVCTTRTRSGVPATTEQPMPVKLGRVNPRVAEMSVWLVRAVPTIDGQGVQLLSPLDPTAETTATETIQTDMYLLPKALADAHYSGTFGNYASGLELGAVTPIEAQGGLGGSVLEIQAELS